MGSSLYNLTKELEIAYDQASFVELQIHDKFKQDHLIINSLKEPVGFPGYFTFHGEGETDGKRRINLCAPDSIIRREYIKESLDLYYLVACNLKSHRIVRLILHPDSLMQRITRKQAIEFLALSLVEISDGLKDIECICIEPRGGDRQGKVLRTEIEDIRILEQYLISAGIRNIGLCIDVAQLFIIHGNKGILHFLNELKSIRLPVKELHISDVITNEKTKNRVAMEVGKGRIDWKLILTLILQHCSDLLIETLGGVKVFQRSKSYLDSLLT